MSLILVAVGCRPELPPPRAPDGDSDADTDVDTDVDTDADVDTDPETGPPAHSAAPPALVPVTLVFLDVFMGGFGVVVPDVECMVEGQLARTDATGAGTLWLAPRPDPVVVECVEQAHDWFLPTRVALAVPEGSGPLNVVVPAHTVNTLHVQGTMWGLPPYDEALGTVTVGVVDPAGRGVAGARVWVEAAHGGSLRQDPSVPELGWSPGAVTLEGGEQVWFTNVAPGPVVVRARAPGMACTLAGRWRPLVEVLPRTHTRVQLVCTPR